MKVILIGYMGSGKTSVGKLLAENLQLPFLDLDAEIEKALEMTVSDIFETKGEVFFRRMENKIFKELLSTLDSFVLATGGGTPCYADSLEAMLSADNAITIYLKTPISVLANRLYNERIQRPLIAHIETFENLIEFIGIHVFERAHCYNQAEIVLDCDAKHPKEIVESIQHHLL